MGQGDASQHLGFEGGFVVDAETVDGYAGFGIGWLCGLRGAGGGRWRVMLLVETHAANPFSAIAQTPHALDVVRTGPGGGKEVPERVGGFGKVGEFLGGEEWDVWVFGVVGGHFVAERDGGAPGGFGARDALLGGEGGASGWRG